MSDLKKLVIMINNNNGDENNDSNNNQAPDKIIYAVEFIAILPYVVLNVILLLFFRTNDSMIVVNII